MDKTRKLPFSVNRNDARSLVDQVADGLRQAIVSGYWRVGDEIPSTRELVPMLGVSHIVTRAALSRLTAEGYVLTRHGLHPVVRDQGAKQWRGHVVFVYDARNIGYFQTSMAETLRRRLNEAGYLFTRASASFNHETGKSDFSLLDAALSKSVDLVLAMTSWRELPGRLKRAAVPFAYISTGGAYAFGEGTTRFNRTDALRDMAEACRAAGIRKAVAMHCYRLSSLAKKAFTAAGIAVERKIFGTVGRDGDYSEIERAGLFGFRRIIESGAIDKDTIYYFEDDYLARGALMAMALAGLRAPEDIRVATLANAGFLPAYDRDLTRVEIDPVEAGNAAAEDALTFLNTGRYPDSTPVGYRFIQGATIRQSKTKE